MVYRLHRTVRRDQKNATDRTHGRSSSNESKCGDHTVVRNQKHHLPPLINHLIKMVFGNEVSMVMYVTIAIVSVHFSFPLSSQIIINFSYSMDRQREQQHDSVSHSER